jgi:hypothetical protein
MLSSRMTARTLQDLFVDRDKEIDRFRRSLDGTTGRRIILVTAGPGMGKSWLLRQFVAEAKNKGAHTVLIDFSDRQAYDVLMLVRRARDAIGAEYFNRLTAAINDATAPRITLNEASGGVVNNAGVDLSNSKVQDVVINEAAGRNIIKDNLFIVQSDNPLLLQAMEDRITQVFFECMKDIVQTQRVVFVLDSYENNSTEGGQWLPNAADRWITRELLTRIRDNQLPNTLVTLGGTWLPDFGIEWNAVVGRLKLDPFTINDVTEYLRINRGLSNLSDAQIELLHMAVQGNPQQLGIIGDNLEQANKPDEEEDW